MEAEEPGGPTEEGPRSSMAVDVEKLYEETAKIIDSLDEVTAKAKVLDKVTETAKPKGLDTATSTAKAMELDTVTESAKAKEFDNEAVAAKRKKAPYRTYLHDYFNRDLDTEKTCVKYDDGDGVVKELSYREVDLFASKVEDFITEKTEKRGIIGVVQDMNHLFPSVQLGVMRSGCGVYNLSRKEWMEGTKVAAAILRMKHVIVDDEAMEQNAEWIQKNISSHATITFSNDNDTRRTHDRLHFLTLTLKPDPDLAYHDGGLSSFRFAYAMRTSGTTGTRKLVLVPHKAITPNIADLSNEVWHLKSTDVIWGVSPPTFDPCVVDLFCAMGIGGTILYGPETLKYDGCRLGLILQKHKVSVIQITPSLLRRLGAGLVKSGYFGKTSPLKVLALGGEKCLNKMEIKALLSVRMYQSLRALVNLYGLTEMSCWASYGHINPFNDDPICAGHSLLETTVTTDNFYTPQSEAVGNGVVEIIIASSSRICTVMDEEGRIQQEDMNIGSEIGTSKNTLAMRMKTGDYGILHDPHHLGIEIIGRFDSIVKRNGRKVSLSLIERSAMRTNLLKTAQCVEYNGKIFLIVMPKDDSHTLLGLGSHMRAKFCPSLKLDVAPDCYPNCIIATKSVPVNENGKMDITAIMNLVASQRYPGRGELEVSLPLIQSILHPLWLSATGQSFKPLRNILKQNFFEVGGVSAGAVWMIEAFWTYCRMYGSPAASMAETNVQRDIAGSDFSELCNTLEGVLKRWPMKASVALVSDDQLSCHWMSPVKSGTTNSPSQLLRNVPFGRIVLPGYPVEIEVSRSAQMQDRIELFSPRNIPRVFEYDLTSCIDAAVVVSTEGQKSGVAIVGSHSGTVIAVDTDALRNVTNNGGRETKDPFNLQLAVLWSRCFPGRLEADVLINKKGSFVYISCHNQKVYKLCVLTGSVDSAFKCDGAIRSKGTLNNDDSILLTVDDTNRLYAINTYDMTLRWSIALYERVLASYEPLLHEDKVFVTTVMSGVNAYALNNGVLIWPKDKPNKAITPPVIWNSGADKTWLVFGTTDGFEVRDINTGKLVSCHREPMMEAEPSYHHQPILHKCSFEDFSELIFVTRKGKGFRVTLSETGDMTVINFSMKPSNACPIVVCTMNSPHTTREHDEYPDFRIKCRKNPNIRQAPSIPVPPNCYLLLQPKDEDAFLAYSLKEPFKVRPALQPVRIGKENFSRPVNYKDMLIFGGRDNKLHIIFSPQATVLT